MGNGEKRNALRSTKATEPEAPTSRDARRDPDIEFDPLPDPIYHRTDERSFYFFETLLDEAHPSSKLFYDYLLEAALLHRDKQRDYGKETDPFANVRASEEWGIPGWVGCMVRANDKMRRLQTLATEGTLTNEAARDSFLDLAVYSIIGLVLYEQALSR